MMTTENVSRMPAVAAPVGTAVPYNERDAFELSLRKAKVYAAADLVPTQYRDNIPNCLIAMNMARRIGADELQVMQNLYIVQGKPGWSGQFLIATFNQSGKFSALRFEWRGKSGDKEWACRAYATEKATGDRIEGAWVTWKMVEAEGWSKKAASKWLTMPEQMFMYRAAAFLVRTHAPEIAMGLQTVEELREVIEVDAYPAPTKTDAVLAALKARTPAAPTIDTAGEVLPPAAPEIQVPPQADPPRMSYATVREQLDSASDVDQLDQAAAHIELVSPAKQQKELTEYYRTRRATME
jgi:hypothetical protein